MLIAYKSNCNIKRYKGGTMINQERIYDNLKRLVAMPSISGTVNESRASDKLVELLYEIPYFKENENSIKLIPLKNDIYKRSVVTALYESEKRTGRTIILTGHYDVVDVEEYGHNKEKAFDIDAIKKYIHELPLDNDTVKDYESGDWIFGRGTADMKFGLALCLELMRHFSEENIIDGNILFLAVPGEETNSEGMLAAVPFLNEIQKEKNLSYSALLLAECHMPNDLNEPKCHYIHIGASGKVMPLFFFAGEATHAGEPFEGLDPNLLANELYKKIHLNTEYCQEKLGEITPPPVCLKQQDLKHGYSVSTPLYAAAYYNLITVSLDPEELMKRLTNHAELAFQNACNYIEDKIQDYERQTGKVVKKQEYKPVVISFDNLYKEVKKSVEDIDSIISTAVFEYQNNNIELQQISINIVKMLYELYPQKCPMIIISIIPPYYPDIYPDTNDRKVNHVFNSINKTIEYASRNYGETIKIKNYYMGISDLSYTGLRKDYDFDILLNSLVGIDSAYYFPKEEMKEINVPGIILGAYGKDFHKHTERLNYSYNFNVLPYLYEKFIISLFN